MTSIASIRVKIKNLERQIAKLKEEIEQAILELKENK